MFSSVIYKELPPEMSGNAISIHGLVKRYGGRYGSAKKQPTKLASDKLAPDKLALDDIDLNIPKGCIFGLLGPNGAGKSTLINILAGTVIKTAGNVNIWGADLDKQPRQLRANIGIVPQELNIDVYFSPRELLDYTAGMYGIKKSERYTDELLDIMGLTEKADAYARTLSGGMRRRLLIGKAMVHRPPVLVLDEPTAGVDLALRRRLWSTVKRLNKQGVTIVLTTHYLEEAQMLCDHVAILNHGKLITSQSKQALLASAEQKELIITLPQGLPAILPASVQALSPQISENEMTIHFNPQTTSAGKILSQLSAANIMVGDINTNEPDLEDIFLTLTGGKTD